MKRALGLAVARLTDLLGAVGEAGGACRRPGRWGSALQPRTGGGFGF